MAITTTPKFGFQLSDGNDVFDNDKFLKGNFQLVEDNAAKKTQEATFKLQLLNGAGEDSGRGVQVFKDEMGLVHIWINITYGTDLVVANKIAVLGTGYRPAFTITDGLSGFTGDLSTIRHGNITINTAGEIITGAPMGGGWQFIHKGIVPFKGI